VEKKLIACSFIFYSFNQIASCTCVVRIHPALHSLMQVPGLICPGPPCTRGPIAVSEEQLNGSTTANRSLGRAGNMQPSTHGRGLFPAIQVYDISGHVLHWAIIHLKDLCCHETADARAGITERNCRVLYFLWFRISPVPFNTEISLCHLGIFHVNFMRFSQYPFDRSPVDRLCSLVYTTPPGNCPKLVARR